MHPGARHHKGEGLRGVGKVYPTAPDGFATGDSGFVTGEFAGATAPADKDTPRVRLEVYNGPMSTDGQQRAQDCGIEFIHRHGIAIPTQFPKRRARVHATDFRAEQELVAQLVGGASKPSVAEAASFLLEAGKQVRWLAALRACT